jgi:hypothetical protein
MKVSPAHLSLLPQKSESSKPKNQIPAPEVNFEPVVLLLLQSLQRNCPGGIIMPIYFNFERRNGGLACF